MGQIDRLKGDSPIFNPFFLEGWRRCLLLHRCLTSARVIPDLLDITTCCAGSSARSSLGSNTVGCFTGRRHRTEKGLMRSSSSFMHPLCSWAVRAFALLRAGGDPKWPESPCPSAFGGSSAAHRARLHTGELLPQPHAPL